MQIGSLPRDAFYIELAQQVPQQQPRADGCLGIEPTPIKEALAETVAWFRSHPGHMKDAPMPDETIEELPADDPATAAQTDLDAETVASIAERLDAMDRGHAWTRDALHAIEDYEDATVGELAQQLERDVRRLKTDVRRLKALALTDRTDFGYRITARGSAFLAAEEGRSE